MRYVIAAYDAPHPALVAVAALQDAGVADGDVALRPSPPGRAPGDLGAPTDPSRLPEWLASLSCAGAADLHAEAARRGAILLVVRCPTLSAPIVAGILAATAPLDPVQAARRWAAEPGTRYEWGDWCLSGLEPGEATEAAS